MISDNRTSRGSQSSFIFRDDELDAGSERIVELIQDRVIAMSDWQAQTSWIDHEPSKECFSDDPNALAAFVEQSFEQETERHKLLAHFLECDLCSFAVAELLRATNGSHVVDATRNADCCSQSERLQDKQPVRTPSSESEWVNWFEEAGLRPDGPTVFPDFTVADNAWEFGRLLIHPRRHELLKTITNASINALQSLRLSRSILLVAFSDALHTISIAIASGLKRKAGSDLDIHVVGVKRFHEPCLLCKPSVVKNKSVVILTDVVHEGRFLHKLWDIVGSRQPSAIRALTLVNQQYTGPYADRLVHLGREEKEIRFRINILSNQGRGMRYFNPVAGVAHHAAPCVEEAPWDHNDVKEWMPFIERTGALKKNLRIGKSTYPFAIDVLTLLKDRACKRHITARATETLSALGIQGRWVFVYPAPRGRRAGQVAALLTEITGWPHTRLGNTNDADFMHIGQDVRRTLGTVDGVMIVDAAIRTGDTLRSQVDLLRAAGVTNIAAFYVLDLRRDKDRRAHAESFSVPVISLCRVPFGFAPTTSVKSAFTRRFKDMEREIVSTDMSSNAKLAVRTFCERVTKRRGGRNSVPQAKPVHSQDVETELTKGTAPLGDLIEDVATGRRPNLSLTRFFTPSQALEDEAQARDARYSINNTASPGFIQELALLFAAQGDYSWLTKDWLVLHEDILTNQEASWEFLAGIAFDARSKDCAASKNLRNTFQEFREILRERERGARAQLLFESEDAQPVFEERCGALIELVD